MQNKFNDYLSRQIVRRAHKVTEADQIVKISENYSEINGLRFAHYEPVKVGDYIVHLDENDVYHCKAKIFKERNIVTD